MIGRLQTVPVRELWRHEAHNFTTWLAENLDLLSEHLNLPLTLVSREVSAGAFSADILAEDGQGNPVIIENQLEPTDHDHLGKLITYMSNLGAKTAIWITTDPRPEHEKAVQWLNETLPADTSFYLVRLSAFRINDSVPAPHLSVVAGPTQEARDIGAQKKELAERHLLRLEFWRELLAKARQRTQLHARISPGTDNWIGAGAGKSGLGWNYVILMDGARAELYIDTGSQEKNKQIFDYLHSQRNAIEAKSGELIWQRLDDRRACRIYKPINVGGLADRSKWSSTQEAMIEAMIALEQALGLLIQKIT